MMSTYKEFSEIQHKLDRLGKFTGIQRVNTTCFNVLINFEIVKTYRTRISCKRRIVKLLNELSNGD